MLYKIVERVTKTGHWITWEGIYTTKEAAQAVIDKAKAKNAFVAKFARNKLGKPMIELCP